MSTSRTRFRVAVAIAICLIAGGLLASAVIGPSSFGWFAYQPVPTDGPVPVMLFPRQLLALAVTLIGALLLSLLIGFRIGQRYAVSEQGRLTPLRATRGRTGCRVSQRVTAGVVSSLRPPESFNGRGAGAEPRRRARKSAAPKNEGVAVSYGGLLSKSRCQG